MTLTFSVQVNGGAALTIGSGCTATDPVLPIVCTALSTPVGVVTTYVIQLLNTHGSVVDTLTLSATGLANPMSISFDFKYYYFALIDGTTVIHNVTSGVSLSVGGSMAQYSVTPAASFYWDQLVSGSVAVIITLTTSSTVLYTNTITLNTFNYLVIEDVIKIVSNFTAPIGITGTGVDASQTCSGTCYITYSGTAASVVLTAAAATS